MIDIETQVRHVRNVARYEGITQGQANVLLSAADALESEHKARLAAEAELARLRAAEPPCDGGCNNAWGPDETCSAHGRPMAEVWKLAQAAAAENASLRAVIEKIRQHHTRLGRPHLNGCTCGRIVCATANLLAAVPGNPETTCGDCGRSDGGCDRVADTETGR